MKIKWFLPFPNGTDFAISLPVARLSEKKSGFLCKSVPFGKDSANIPFNQGA
ncbi:MAG: hypothetical protein LBU06_12525 [Desulfovibrio sp.]|jgi:hypothetical protein|nr:hypothetical protein [Desulfovibrio sp.]